MVVANPLLLILHFIESGQTRPASDGKFGFGTFKPGYPGNFGTATVDQLILWNRELTDSDVSTVYTM